MTAKMPETLQQFLSKSRLKVVPRNQIVLYEGDSSSEVYFVHSGFVKIHSIDDSGNEKLLHILGPQTVMPFAFFSGGNVATKWFYTTLTDCELYVLDRNELERLLFSDAAVGMFVINRFSLEVHEILVRLDSLGKSDIPFKLQTALTYLVVCHGERLRQTWWRIPFPVNHQLLADMIGVTRESAAIAIKQLSDGGALRYPHVGQLEINYAKLERKDTRRPEPQTNGSHDNTLPHSHTV